LFRVMRGPVRVPQAIALNAGYLDAEAKKYAPLNDHSLDGTREPLQGPFSWPKSKPIKAASADKKWQRRVTLHGDIDTGVLPVVPPTRATEGPVPFLDRFHGARGQQKSLSSPVRVVQSDGTVDYVGLKNDAGLVRQLLLSQLHTGESLVALAAPFKRGRRDRWPAGEQERYERLVQLVAYAKARGATLEAISEAIGRDPCDRKGVQRLVEANRKLNATKGAVLGVEGEAPSPLLAPRTSTVKGR
jgi:hypothetical protein